MFSLAFSGFLFCLVWVFEWGFDVVCVNFLFTIVNNLLTCLNGSSRRLEDHKFLSV